MIGHFIRTATMQKILKQPLLHFWFFGFMLFLLYAFTGAEETKPDASVIQVGRAELLSFMQYRANAFNEELFARQLDAMSAEQRQLLVEDYYREEALYREALAMGMDEGDYNIKLRMVEKLQFLLQDAVSLAAAPDEETLQQYYQDNADVYRRPASYTFTHVFVNDPEHSEAGRMRAEALLAELRDNAVDFMGASEYGDTFPYLQNYVRRSRDFIRNNFNDDFADWLDTLEPNNTSWSGPVMTDFGFHLVLLSNRNPAVLPEFAEMRERLLDDYQIEQQYLSRRAAEDYLIEKYELRVEGF